jgi:hypothetical protein
MLGGSTALVGAAAASIVESVRAVARRRLPGRFTAGGDAGLLMYVLPVRPWLLRGGAKPDENARARPGDELVPEAGVQTTRAVMIDASVDAGWPWLAQIGQDRGGFYSYLWPENVAGCRMRNADRFHPEWQHRGVGESVLLHGA